MATPVYPQTLDLSVLSRYTGRRFSSVVYGLVDPRQPGLVAYVGRSKGHVLGRYFQHISDGTNASGGCSQRVRWIAELVAIRSWPGLILIESVTDRRYLLAERESWWIAQYKKRGEAWVNRICEIQWEHRQKE
ncbi:MAG TPA: hypothetical protein VGP44_11265 [Gemmatimonadales bacterium]|nr:hypothetical protein [Gemmatimonadales bacterium]